jgi:hypothetical protein
MHTDQIHMHKFPIILETTAQSHTEDQGMARIMEIPGADPDQGVFVRIQSWHKLGLHAEMDHMEGRRIRVTIEVLDD